MPQFILAYRGGRKPATPEEGARHQAKWKAWVEGLGAAAVNPGMPLGKSVLVDGNGIAEGGVPHALDGITIVEAAGLDEAVRMARDCPYVEMGAIEVAQIMTMGS